MSERKRKECPFDSPNFLIKADEPCPVCGIKAMPYNSIEEIDEACATGLLGGKVTYED